MPTRRCGVPGCTSRGRRTRCGWSRWSACWMPRPRSCPRPSTRAARASTRCTSTSTGSRGTSTARSRMYGQDGRGVSTVRDSGASRCVRKQVVVHVPRMSAAPQECAVVNRSGHRRRSCAGPVGDAVRAGTEWVVLGGRAQAGYDATVPPLTPAPQPERTGPITVMIVDDHEVVRRGIAEVVERAERE